MGLSFIIVFYALLTLFGFLFLLFWKKLDNFERVVLSFPVGSAFYSITAFILSEFIGIKLSLSMLSVLLITMLIMIVTLNLFFKNLKIPRIKKPKLSFAMIVLILFVIAMSLHALTVPIYKNDPYLYHLPFAEEIYETGHLPKDINPSVARFEYAYPPYQYMMYAFTSFFNGSMTAVPAKILPLIFGLLLLALIYRITRTFADRETSLFSVLLFIAIYYYSHTIIYSNTDITVAFYVVAAIYVLLKIIKQPSPQYYLLFAILTSMAYWTKYTAIVSVLVVWGILAVYSVTANKKALLVVVAVVALLIISPHLIRNTVETANPVYPALTSVLGGKDVTPWYESNVLSRYLPKPLSNFGPEFFLKLSYLLLPLTATVMFMKKSLPQKLLIIFALFHISLWFLFLRNSGGGLLNSYRYLVPSVAALSAAAAPAFMLFLKQGFTKKMKNAFIITSLPILAFLGFMLRQGNAFAENMVLIAAISAAIIFTITKLNLKFAASAMLIVFLVPSALSLTVYPAIFSQELLSDVTYRDSGHIPEWIDENLPQDATILYLFEYIYLIPRETVSGDDPSVQPIFTGIPPEEVMQLLKNRGITHIYSTDAFGGSFSFYSENTANITLAEPRFTLLYNETITGKQRGLYRINYLG